MPQVRTIRINGERLRDLRTQRGLSGGKLAKKIGRARQSVARLELGGTASLVFAYQLARALDVDIAEFTIPADAGESEADDAAETECAA